MEKQADGKFAASALTDDERKAFLHDINEHLDHHGAKHWALLQKRWPQVSTSMFWRLVKQVRAGTPDTERLARAVKKAKVVSTKNLPHPIPPAVIMDAGDRVDNYIDFLSQFQTLMADIDMVRAFSTKDEGTAIKNPNLFAQQIKLRRDVMETMLKAMDSVYDMRRMQTFYETVIAEIQKVDPETGKRITEALAALDAKRGYTLNARVK